jgi:phenylacetic acid degradation operon negative regulatory protein
VPAHTPTLDDLRSAACSDGAPSARNLLVTVFGDALLPHGEETQISVRSLSRLLGAFGVNERLVRTSLTRLVNDGLLTTTAEGRRSFYRVAAPALDLFRQADQRIYRGTSDDWDGSWTIVVIEHPT